MAITRPTVTEILARLQGDFAANLPDFDPYLPRSDLFAILAANAAGMHELNGRLVQLARNHFADQADEEHLIRSGDQLGVYRIGAAKAGPGAAHYTGTDATSIPEATVHVNASGYRYVSTSGATVSGGEVTCPIQAIEVGAASNMPAAAAIELEEPISGITPGSGTITVALEGGADDQDLESFRADVLSAWRYRGQGGTLRDFYRWVFESGPGLWTRVFVVRPATGSNLINLYAVDDSQDPAGNNIARAAGDYTAAEDYINEDHRRPLCADLHVDAPTLINLNPAVTLNPNTSAVQAAVTEEIIRLLIREFPGPDGIGGTLRLSHLDEAISRAAGEVDHTTTSPVADVNLGSGELLRIGTPVYS